MIEIVTQAADDQRETFEFAQFFPPLSRSDRGEHDLSDVEGVSPIVVRHISVVLLDRQQPPTQRSVINVKPTGQVQVYEHS